MPERTMKVAWMYQMPRSRLLSASEYRFFGRCLDEPLQHGFGKGHDGSHYPPRWGRENDDRFYDVLLNRVVWVGCWGPDLPIDCSAPLAVQPYCNSVFCEEKISSFLLFSYRITPSDTAVPDDGYGG